MFKDKFSDYVAGAAAKYLTAVDANPNTSNQHEFGGLPAAGFIEHLGRPAKGDKKPFPAKMFYFGPLGEVIESDDTKVTWYDVRHEDRAPEYRLYYKSNSVTKLLKETDFFLIAKMKDGSLILIFCNCETEIESQLRSIFGLTDITQKFQRGKLLEGELLLPVRLLLEELGLISEEKVEELPSAFVRLNTKFGGKFPSTLEMSSFSRNELIKECDPIAEPDKTLMKWMNYEEFLFRALEKQQIAEKLRQGFGKNGDDVDAFISFSLSIQNRRKARVGFAFESHLEAIFQSNNLVFERGNGKNRYTENKSRPDFMFPGFSNYHDKKFPDDKLLMLGAKTTCKDRWRQVLAEAVRIKRKHLVTIEVGISEAQTAEMKSRDLQLVVPQEIQKTYSPKQQKYLATIADFIAEVKTKASKSK